MILLRSTETVFANEVEVLVVGAGACGMTAALAASTINSRHWLHMFLGQEAVRL